MNKTILISLFYFLISYNYTFAQNNYWQSFSPKFGTIRFSYPNGWEVLPTDNFRFRFTENYCIQPRGQKFTGARGQVKIYIYDPVYVGEEANTLNPVFSYDVFKRFTTAMGYSPSSRIKTENSNGTIYTISQINTGYETKTIGVKSKFGYMYIIAMYCAINETSVNSNVLYNVARSLSGGEPVVQLTSAETAVSNWYSAISNGQTRELYKHSCSAAQQANALISLASSAFGIDLNNMVAQTGQMFNFSSLRYYTIGGNNEMAFVKVCGCVVNPRGQIVPFHQYCSGLGGTNVFIVKLENGAWKVCQSVRR